MLHPGTRIPDLVWSYISRIAPRRASARISDHSLVQPTVTVLSMFPVERLNQEVKKRVRSHEHGLPFVMCKVVIIYFILYCMRCINLQPISTSIDRISPSELKLDTSRDLSVGFGDYLEATVPNYLALLLTGNFAYFQRPASDGYSRGSDPSLDCSVPLDDEDDDMCSSSYQHFPT